MGFALGFMLDGIIFSVLSSFAIIFLRLKELVSSGRHRECGCNRIYEH